MSSLLAPGLPAPPLQPIWQPICDDTHSVPRSLPQPLVDASADRRRDAEDDVENRRQQLHAEERTLETELAALDAKFIATKRN